MKRAKGITMIVSGAMLWGATGPMMEWILRTSDMSISFMLTVRLFLAGAFILMMLKVRGKKISLPWRQKVWARQLILFGVFGMLGIQYTFVASIDTSNAVIATLFQFLAPIFLIVFVTATQKKWPPIAQVLGMLVTLIGLFLLLTNGSLAGFALSKVAVLWGIALGFAFSFYTLYPVRLMQEWGVLLSIGWGMVIAGTTLFFTNPMKIVTDMEYLVDWRMATMLLLVIIVGTFAFILFMGSMKYITPVETSILSSFEPLTAMVISVIWFGQVLGMWQLTGSVIMLIGVTWLSIAGNKKLESDGR
ncbi:EamA family transporter [Filibacter tadaridae]|uniref:Putative inner membrane transporter YicL n=1 Tax=Filibacter tadaridae TaxID=2483811 RepID=A0A3P5WDQ3_9BACL|nr:EamA family transporter [Filibacter tadaridae]VDC19324.1 putative inner membrane transporter YicL [Filibacter tadaridae]